MIVCCGVLWKHWYGPQNAQPTAAIGWTRAQVDALVASARPTRQLDFSSDSRQLRSEGASWLLDAWSHHVELENIEFARQSLGVAGVRLLAPMLTSLSTLGLSACDIGDTGASLLASALENNPRVDAYADQFPLTSLNISGS